MEKLSGSHDLGIKSDAHNHNTSKNSLGNGLKHTVLSHGGNSSLLLHRRRQITSELAEITDYVINLKIGLWKFVLMRQIFSIRVFMS